MPTDLDPSLPPTSGEQLQQLANAYFKSRVGGTALVDALGCTNLQYGGARDLWRVSEPSQPSLEDEALVRKILLDLFFDPLPHAPATEMRLAIINGLSKHERWRGCLASENGAYLLAAQVIAFPSSHDSTLDYEGGIALRNATAYGICLVLNEWLSSMPVDDPQSFRLADVTSFGTMVSFDMARALFGAVWCDIAMPVTEIAYSLRSATITQQRPPFLPGLLPAHLEPVALDLPSMESP